MLMRGPQRNEAEEGVEGNREVPPEAVGRKRKMVSR